MKRTLILLLVALFCSLISCKRELIEKPLSTISPSNFFKTQQDFETATYGVIGIQNSTDLYSWGIHYIIEWPSGDYNIGAGDVWQNLRFNSAWYFVDQDWAANYKLINNVNLILDKMKGVTFDQQNEDALKGELLFLRAISYFDLVRIFGKVPVHLTPTTSLDSVSLPESPIKDVYDVVVNDLQQAQTLLPLINPYGPGFATKGSATGLLGEVYIYMAGNPLKDASKWQLALDQLKKIVDVNNPSQSTAPFKYHLEPDFQRLFYQTAGPGYPAKPVIGQVADENGPEAVYEMNFATAPGVLGSCFATSVGGLQIQPWLRNLYDSLDYRKQVTMVTTEADPVGIKYLEKKFQSTGNSWNDNTNNWPYLRFANLVLYLAEAENELNGPTPLALSCLNAIRTRARNADGVPRSVPENYTSADASTKEQFRQLLYKERALEFAGEGQHWFDMIRTGTLEEQLKLQGREQYYNPNLVLFPKPQSQITISKGNITQNPGY